jgi:hypothetical protein
MDKIINYFNYETSEVIHSSEKRIQNQKTHKYFLYTKLNILTIKFKIIKFYVIFMKCFATKYVLKQKKPFPNKYSET